MTRIMAGLALSMVSVSAHGQSAPLADHHQHLFSPTVAVAESARAISVEDLISRLDEAGIRRAAVLSLAYILGDPYGTASTEYARVKAENDWTSRQVARFPLRLVGLCSVNPLKEYAFDELARCAKDPQLRRGLKLHFANSRVDYHNPAHTDRLRRLFAAANGYRMAIVAHVRTSISAKIPYGADEARIFLNEIVPAAPDVPIQIAHLAGAGGYGDPPVDEALSVFAEAIERGVPQGETFVLRCGHRGAARHICRAADTDSKSTSPAGAAADSLWIRRDFRAQLAAPGKLGCVPDIAVNRSGVRAHCTERPALHAVIRSGLMSRV